MTGERLGRIAGHRLCEFTLGATLWDADLYPAPPLLGQPLLVDLAVLGDDRHEDLFRVAGRGFVAVDLFEDRGHGLLGAEVHDLVQDEAQPAHDPPPPDEEDLRCGLEIVLVHPDDVDVLVLVAHHLLPLDRSSHGRQAIPQTCRLLELHLAGRCGHLGLETLQHRLDVAVEELHELGDQMVVVGLGDLADARTGALLDVEQQTRFAELLVPVELVVRAGADGERPQQFVERVADGVRVRVRAEVPRALATPPTHDRRPGPLVGQRDRQERVRLVVHQTHVEAGAVLLDEGVLQHEGLDLVADLDPLHRGRRRHHLRRSRMHVAGVLEVVRQALTQRLGLADVDDATVGVLELVAAGCVRDAARRRSLHHLTPHMFRTYRPAPTASGRRASPGGNLTRFDRFSDCVEQRRSGSC